MSAIDELLERARQKTTGDDAFVQEFPYALELKSPDVTSQTLSSSTVFVFPLAPQELSVGRVYRQSVVPTLGGVVVEERGSLWFTLSISGTFGLSPKAGTDTTLFGPKGLDGTPGFGPYVGITPLSGPLWTRRMLRHFFDQYAELKADPSVSALTTLIWHNFKDDEHWVIVPEQVDLTRSVSSRMMYPFVIRAKAVGVAEAIAPPVNALSALAKVLNSISKAIDAVRTGLALVQAAFQEGSQILGEVRYVAARIDAIIDDVGRIASAASDFADGVVQTASVGSSFVSSVANDLEEIIELIDAVETIPRDVAANYRAAVDGLDSIAMGFKATENASYAAGAAIAKSNGKGLNSLSESDVDSAESAGPPSSAYDMAARSTPSSVRTMRDAGALPGERAFSSYTGFRPYQIRRGDTIGSIAGAMLGNVALWYDIALANGLKPPYISPAGGPGVARPGDTLAIPTTATSGTTAIQRQDANPERLYGRDLRVEETPMSRPGRPAVDLSIDRATYRDVATIGGVSNLMQAVQLRVWTERGTLGLVPEYGLPRVVGLGMDAANVTALQLGFRDTVLKDSRIERVRSMQATISSDTIDFDASLIPVGAAEPFNLETALV